MTKLREIAILQGHLYSDNKEKIKKLFKQFGLAFNQGALNAAHLYIWQGEAEQVEGKFTKDSDGLTIHSTLTWTGKERTPFLDELKKLTEELGGGWKVAGEEELVKEEVDDRKKAIKEMENDGLTKLYGEERKARVQGFGHCPIIKPMITKFLTERYEKFGLKDWKPEEVLDRVYKKVDNERGV